MVASELGLIMITIVIDKLLHNRNHNQNHVANCGCNHRNQTHRTITGNISSKVKHSKC